MALRVTYVGELGWELHVPVEFAATVYDALMEAGRPHGIANAGYRAIESLRLEKGYRAWGADIGPDHSPLVAGLGWAVKLRRNTPVPRPRGAASSSRAKPLPRLLAGFTRRPRRRAARPRDDLPRRPAASAGSSSGGYGYTVGRSIGYGYVRDPEGVDAAYVLAGSYELEVAGERVPATPFLKPALRPKHGAGEGVTIDQARIVIIGGGAIGCGIAYQLAEAGVTDVLVLERESALCASPAPQAAGLVGQVRSSVERTRLAMWSVATFSRLEREAEVKPGWRQTGSLRIAQTPERVGGVPPAAGRSRAEAGLETELIGREGRPAALAGARFRRRLRRSCGARATAISSRPTWSRATSMPPARKGVRFRTGSRVTGIGSSGGRVAARETEQGEIACETVINAAGAHGYHVGRLVGLELPVFPVRHHYVITTPTDWIRPEMPVPARAGRHALRAEPDVKRTAARRLGAGRALRRSARATRLTASRRRSSRTGRCSPASWSSSGRSPGRSPTSRCATSSPAGPPSRPTAGSSSARAAQVPGFVCAVGCNAHGVSGSAGIGRHVVEACSTPSRRPTSAACRRTGSRRPPSTGPWPARQARHVLETYYHIGH